MEKRINQNEQSLRETEDTTKLISVYTMGAAEGEQKDEEKEKMLELEHGSSIRVPA
jgi:hypothetical protein